MAKITDVKQQAKDKTRFNIFLDGQFVFGISADAIFKKRLEIDQDLTQSKIQELIKEDQLSRLVNKAFKFLSFRPRSEKETQEHLLRKGKLKDVKSEEEKNQYEQSVAEAIKKLKRLEQIDDRQFTKWWVEQRQKFKPRGTALLKSELLSKGVAREIIDEVLEINGQDQEEAALAAASKKANSYKNLNREEFKIKMGQFLARRGFSWGTTKKVVDTLVEKRVK